MRGPTSAPLPSSMLPWSEGSLTSSQMVMGASAFRTSLATSRHKGTAHAVYGRASWPLWSQPQITWRKRSYPEELEAFAASDPAVKDGLLKCEVRTWYVAMSAGDD